MRHKMTWSTHEKIWFALAEKLFSGERIYVEITYPATRAGSIGYFEYSDLTAKPTYEEYYEYNKNASYYSKFSTYEQYVISQYRKSNSVIKFDDRKNPIKTDRLEFVWIDDYSGPTKFIYDREKTIKKEVVEENLKDFMGNEINVGDLVSIVDNNNMIVGTVSRYSSTRISLFVKPIKVSTRTYYKSEIICSDPSRIMLVDKELMDRLLIARLSN